MKTRVKDSPEHTQFADIQNKLRDALPPFEDSENGTELRRDLWPDMLRRLGQPQVRVPWFDWALLAVSGAAAILFPALIPALLYHL